MRCELSAFGPAAKLKPAFLTAEVPTLIGEKSLPINGIHLSVNILAGYATILAVSGSNSLTRRSRPRWRC
jgi:hypothetical protein